MDTLDLTALERCLATPERARARLVVTSSTDDDHDLFWAACVKEFGLVLEIVTKLLCKVLREYVTSTRELNSLPFKHIMRLAAQHGLLSEFREALTDSNLPIFVDTHDWALLPESFHPRILDRYEVVHPGAPAPAVPA